MASCDLTEGSITFCVCMCVWVKCEVDCINIEYSVGEVADSETCPQEGRAEFLIMLHVVPEGAKKAPKD